MALPETTQPAPPRHPVNDPEPRTKTIGGSVSESEKDRITEALDLEGFDNESQGVRAILLTFVASAEVRDAVKRALKVSP